LNGVPWVGGKALAEAAGVVREKVLSYDDSVEALALALAKLAEDLALVLGLEG